MGVLVVDAPGVPIADLALAHRRLAGSIPDMGPFTAKTAVAFLPSSSVECDLSPDPERESGYVLRELL